MNKGNNPYKELVINNPNIMTEPENIYKYKGKWGEYFGNSNPITLEIGTGMGNFFSKMCKEFPNHNHIGMELRFKRLQTTETKASIVNNDNYVLLRDFGQNIDKILSHNEIQKTIIFFPDPYANKKKQLKHRMITPEFLEKIGNITQPGGKLYFKTDHDEYFSYVEEAILNQNIWKITKLSYNYMDEDFFDIDNITEFEALYRGENKNINYMELQKI